MAEVEFDLVSKVYPDGAPAVSDLQLHVAEAEFVVLVGPSGCLEELTSRRILIDGRVVNSVTSQHRDVAMVFQSYAPVPPSHR